MISPFFNCKSLEKTYQLQSCNFMEKRDVRNEWKKERNRNLLNIKAREL